MPDSILQEWYELLVGYVPHLWRGVVEGFRFGFPLLSEVLGGSNVPVGNHKSALGATAFVAGEI
jgi:hypothetical protein